MADNDYHPFRLGESDDTSDTDSKEQAELDGSMSRDSAASQIPLIHHLSPNEEATAPKESLTASGRRASMNDLPAFRHSLSTSSSVPEIILEKAALTESGNDLTGNDVSKLAARGRDFAKRQRQRLVDKDGELNVTSTKVRQRNRKYLVDIFTTLLEMKWRYNLLIFALGFLVSWVGFAFIWWLMMYFHEDHIHIDDDNWKPCIANVYDFTTALLFSIETQHTIGYGARMAESHCAGSVIVLMLQSILGVLIQCLITGMIFAKLSRPKRRAATLVFSRNAVICQRDGDFYFLFRLGDVRKSHIVNTVIRATLVRNKLTQEGEVIPLCQLPMELETEGGKEADSYVFLAWPVTITHLIDRRSPLWNISPEDLVTEKFEIIVIFEGTIESSGMTTQVRTSYLPSEILWGHSMHPLITYQNLDGSYKIDYTQFHETVSVETPEISAKDYATKAKRNRKKSSNNPRLSVTFTCPPIAAPKSTSSTGIFRRFRSTLKRNVLGPRVERPSSQSKLDHSVSLDNSSNRSNI